MYGVNTFHIGWPNYEDCRNKYGVYCREKVIHSTSFEQNAVIFQDTYVRLCTNGKETHAISISKGVREGCCISPTLFNIYVADALGKWKITYKGGILRDVTLNILCLLYTSRCV